MATMHISFCDQVIVNFDMATEAGRAAAREAGQSPTALKAAAEAAAAAGEGENGAAAAEMLTTPTGTPTKPTSGGVGGLSTVEEADGDSGDGEEMKSGSRRRSVGGTWIQA